MKQIDDKYIRIGIKRHWTVSDFAKDMEISEAEFIKMLNSAFTNKRQKANYIREIKKNSDAHKKTQVTQAKQTTQASQAKQTTQATQETTTTEVVQGQAQELISESTIEELKEQIYALKSKIYELDSRKSEYLASLNREKLFLQQTLRVLDESRHRIEVLKTDIQTTNTAIKDYKSLVVEKKSILESLTIEVFVYENGSTSGIDVSATPLDTALYSELMGQVGAEDLTVREVKALTKFISYIKVHTDYKYEIIFENALAQELFEKYC